MQRHLLAGLDRLVERRDQLQALAAFETVNQRCALMHQAIDDVVIGAGSVVTKDITTPGTYAGNPARLLRLRK